MEVEIITRTRTASVRTSILVLEAQNRALRSGLQIDPKTSPVFLRFMPFERQLLEDLAVLCVGTEHSLSIQATNQLDGVVAMLFYKWQWTSDVMHQILTDLHPDEVMLDHHGNLNEAFEMVKMMLRVSKNGDFLDNRYQRTEMFVEDNKVLVDRVERGLVDVENIGFYPHPNDEGLWRLLALMFVSEEEDVQSWPGFQEDYSEDESGDGEDPNNNGSDVEMNTDTNVDIAQGHEFGENSPNHDFGILADDGQDGGESGQYGLSSAQMTYPTIEGSATSVSIQDRTSNFALNALREVDALLKLENTWTVWQFSRMYSLLKSRPTNYEIIDKLTRLPCFSEHWKIVEVVVDDDEGECLRGFLAREEFQQSSLHEIAEDFFEDHFLNHVSLAYNRRKHNRSLFDPSIYVEHIPPEQLEPLVLGKGTDNAFSMISRFYLQLGLDPPLVENCTEGGFVLWTPPPQYRKSAASAIHSYYFSEDLLAHQMAGAFTYPGFLVTGADESGESTTTGVTEESSNDFRLLYRRTPIQESSFCGDLRHFWRKWTDTKITHDANDEQKLYLLETLPGIRIRNISETVDRDAAQAFLATILRYQQSSHAAEQEERARMLLGTDYDPSYRYTLRFIDPGQLSNVNQPPAPIGEGSFGRVYKCTWHEKPTVRGDIGAVESGLVALKVATDRWNDHDEQKKLNAQFFRELRLAHSALSGDASGFIPFFGFTQVFVSSDTHELYFEDVKEGKRKAEFALIFDFATEGTVLDYLQHRLRPSQIRWNWLQVSSALESTAGGLSHLHKRGVLHRDIHPNNVLATIEHFSNTSEPEYSCVISDIGEGRLIASLKESPEYGFTVTDRRFGLRDYQAPELPTLGYSRMSDMYALGQLGVDMIRHSSPMLVDERTGRLSVPEKMLHVLQACLADDHGDRYEAVLVVKMLEEITYSLQSDSEIEFIEEENLLREFPCRQLSSWDTFSR